MSAYLGKVAVGAVIMNRMRSSSFPNSLSGVIFEPWSLESVENGLIWSVSLQKIVSVLQPRR